MTTRCSSRLASVSLVVLSSLSLAGVHCAPTEERSRDDPAQARAAVVGGEPDPSDPAVVLVAMKSDTSGGGTCTGFVVSPHVIVTAAHCLDPRTVGADAKPYYVFLGGDLYSPSDGAKANYVRIAETHFHPSYVPKVLSSAHDIGVVITQTPLPMAPLRMNRRPLDSALVGRSVRVVGYGTYDRSADADTDNQAAKHSAVVAVGGVDDELISFSDPEHGIAEGDSGGPSLMKRDDGTEVVVGIHSFAKSAEHQTFDTRMDVYASSYVDDFIKKADPDFPLDTAEGADGGAPDDGGAVEAPPASAAPVTTTSGCTLGASSAPRTAGALAIVAGTLAALAARRRRSVRTAT